MEHESSATSQPSPTISKTNWIYAAIAAITDLIEAEVIQTIDMLSVDDTKSDVFIALPMWRCQLGGHGSAYIYSIDYVVDFCFVCCELFLCCGLVFFQSVDLCFFNLWTCVFSICGLVFYNMHLYFLF
ncbi:hypothetical protein KSP39_PZI023158 [Platanthera zijinensis]|uniref:Uncharacterized protein n=1 Tax=Platanthera zijinensis TaxID=2320716 RepID=A0AAP0AW09_9ASPA